MATPSNKVTAKADAKIAAAVAASASEVTPEVTVTVNEEPAAEEAPQRRFVTTTEDAPPTSALPGSLRKLNAKTLAEQKAGRDRLALYDQPGE